MVRKRKEYWTCGVLEKKNLAVGQECLRRGEFRFNVIFIKKKSSDVRISNKLQLKNYSNFARGLRKYSMSR